jgi:hypothetical protein
VGIDWANAGIAVAKRRRHRMGRMGIFSMEQCFRLILQEQINYIKLNFHSQPILKYHQQPSLANPKMLEIPRKYQIHRSSILESGLRQAPCQIQILKSMQLYRNPASAHMQINSYQFFYSKSPTPKNTCLGVKNTMAAIGKMARSQPISGLKAIDIL